MNQAQRHLRISVIKKLYFADLIDQYSTRDYPDCDVFTEGTTFLIDDPDEMPGGFCDWAWQNIGRELHACWDGEQLPWVTQPNTFIACCTDGLRPVVFEIKLIEDA